MWLKFLSTYWLYAFDTVHFPVETNSWFIVLMTRSRLLDAEASKLPLRSGIKGNASGFPISPQAVKKPKKKKDDESDDETTAFRSRPTAVVNRPMVTAPVERAPKQVIKLSMAQVDPSASFEERVAQFDHLEAVAKKRMYKKKKTLRKLYKVTFNSHKLVTFLCLAANKMPEDLVAFLEKIFAKPLHTWNQDPGYASRVTSMFPPPSNSSILVSKFH